MNLSRNISRLLYWLQLASATACVILSLIKLIKQNYGEIQKGDTDNRNRKSALTIFYALALAEALLFLLEKAYWEWNVMYKKLLDQVNDQCELGWFGLVSVRQFIYDAYSKCVNGSIFDRLKMDLVTFAMELLDSNFRTQQMSSSSESESYDIFKTIQLSKTLLERRMGMVHWNIKGKEVMNLHNGMFHNCCHKF